MTRTLPGMIVIVLLLAPLLLMPIRRGDVRRYVEQVEKREQASRPSFRSLPDQLDEPRRAAFSDALVDRFSLRDLLIPLGRRIGYAMPAAERFGDVVTGADDWLFYWPSLVPAGEEPESARVEAEAARVAMLAFLERSRAARARVNVLIAPDKASIYPEKLSGLSRRKFDFYRDAREVLPRSFARAEAPELIDVWSIYRNARAESPTLLYEAQGTHHTVTTSFRMAQAIVDAARPGVWDPDAIAPHVDPADGLPPLHVGDLAEMAGLLHLTQPVDLASLVRPGVSMTSGSIDGRSASNAELVDGRHWNRPMRVQSASDGALMIEGSTLIVHDSFIGGRLRVPLSQYFADVSFIHADDVSNCELARAIGEYDRIFIELVERRAAPEFNRLFAECSADARALAPSLELEFDAGHPDVSNGFGAARDAI